MENDKKSSAGAYTNSPAQNTSESSLRSLVDWVSFTSTDFQNWTDVAQLLDIEFDLFEEQKSGGLSYTNQVRYGNIAIYYNKGIDSNLKGVRCEMSGQGCRQFEDYHRMMRSKMTWSVLFALLLNFNDIKVTRIDLAIDDFYGYFKMSTLKRYCSKGWVRSPFKSWRSMQKGKVADGSELGHTIYLGSPKSRIMIRFYDKYKEIESKGGKVDENITAWNRTEIQMRDERAQSIALLLAYNKDAIGEYAQGILKHYITFCKPKGKDTNKARWTTANFWEKFLHGVESLQLTEDAPDKTIERIEKWITYQVDASQSLLYLAHENDFGLINKLLIDGMQKLNKKHLTIFNRYQLKQGKKQFTQEEFEEYIQESMQELIVLDKKSLNHNDLD